MTAYCSGCYTMQPTEPCTINSPCAHAGPGGTRCRVGAFSRDAWCSREYIFADLFKPEPQLWAPEFL